MPPANTNAAGRGKRYTLLASSHAPSARRLHRLASSNSESASGDAAIPLHIPSRLVFYTD
jgi:hypothetical protein